MRILHTADWHLGHSLSNQSRFPEHEAFLVWLLNVLENEAIDVLLIAGDIFDTANPSAKSERQWYDFLCKARLRCPKLQTVVIAGNHDSASRLEAPVALLETYGVHVIGRLSRTADGDINTDNILVELKDSDGKIAALCAAVPFLRPSDLATHRLSLSGTDDPLIEGVRDVYHEIFEAARARITQEQAIVAMGHCYMTNTRLSELSERKILGGNQHALPADIFPDDILYVALGHLHLPQAVGKDHIRYSGSPIPLSLSERTYRHEVRIVDIHDGIITSSQSIRIPRTVNMIRIPHEGSLLLEDLLEELAKLPDSDPDQALHNRDFLEVCITLPQPEPTLQTAIHDALKEKAVRLIKITVTRTGNTMSLAAQAERERIDLADIDSVFKACYARQYDHDDQSSQLPKLLELFHELHDEVRQSEGESQ